MFLGSPAWIGLLVVGTLALAFTGNAEFVQPQAGLAIVILVPIMWFAPQLATLIDILLSAKARQSYGGTFRFLASAVIEILFTVMLCPIMWFGHTMFLIGLLLGRRIGWGGQTRDDHRVPLALAARQLWPHTILGVTSLAVLAATQPWAIPYALYLAAGPALAIPYAVVTALPSVGIAFARLGIGRLPEETEPPPSLQSLALPAVAAAASLARPQPA
jgi:membrane glycosyltransferase